MKLKRLFTAILSAALTLSLCAMPAMATEGGRRYACLGYNQKRQHYDS